MRASDEPHVTALQPLHRNSDLSAHPYAHDPSLIVTEVCGEGVARVGRSFTPHVTLGPPGTGKTHRMQLRIADEVRAAVPLSSIAYVAFSRAAAATALRRVRETHVLAPNDTRWFRTIHSVAYFLLGCVPGELVDDEAWGLFGKTYGYTFSDAVEDDDPHERAGKPLPCRTKDDLLRFAYDWGRNCCFDVEATIRRFKAGALSPPVFRTFVERYERFKREGKLRDFTDLLEEALASELRPPVTVAFIDEAQDLSPLQIALVELWFASCERIYVAGDDDQAVFVHNGADPSWIIALARRCPVERLSESHRLPSVIQSFAAQIISQNRTRVPKEFCATASGGEVRFLDRRRAIALIDGSQSTYVLARNRAFLRPIAQGLIEQRTPFVVDGNGASAPLSDQRLVRAVRACVQLERTRQVRLRARDLEEILSFIPQDTELRPKGVGGKLRPHRNSEFGFGRTHIEEEFGLGALLARIDENGALAPLSKLATWKRKYLQALVDRYGDLPEPRVTLTSMHAAKGGEAELVVVLPDMSRSTFREYRHGGVRGLEAETRVFYVAVTRASKTLVIVDPKGRRHFEFPRLRGASPADVRERWEERSAIREHEGGLTREEAESGAPRGRLA